MSHIDQLIAKHCPQGVQFRPVGEITTKPSNIKWPESDETEEYFYIDLSSVDRVTKKIGETSAITSANAPSRARQMVNTDDVIFATTRPAQMRWAIIPPEYDGQIASTGYCVLRPKSDYVLTSFLAHVLGADDFRRYIEANQVEGNYPSIPDNRVRAYRIPVPPLDVQYEIVRILDEFSKLEAELEAELEARKQQYEHYRAGLLVIPESASWTTLGELCSIETGKLNANAAVPDGEHAFFTTAQEISRIDQYRWDTEALLVAGNANVGDVKHYIGKFDAYQRTYVLTRFSELVDVKFLFYILKNGLQRYLEGRTNSAAMTYIVLGTLRDLPVPLLPVAEQHRIVESLDKFDALVNGLSVGLPAELAARRQQYEYYRDQLLTFKELGAAA